ncbi:MAG TPA: hypothetical protein VIX86_03360, partial [Streptosporangiaceae bacterium]
TAAPEPLADDKTDPVWPAASGGDPEPASQQPAGAGAAQGKAGGRPGGKGGGRGRAKAKARPAASEPADAADEWISLLTADPEE